MSAVGRSIINRTMLVLLLLVEYVAWSRRRSTCTDRKSRWQVFGSAEGNTADESRAACDCTSSVEEEGNTAGVQSRAWWKANLGGVEDDTADESRATCSSRHVTTTSSVEGSNIADHSRAACDGHLKTPERSAGNFGSSVCAINQSRESSNGRLTLSEESGDNFGNAETREQTASLGRAIDDGQTTMSEKSADGSLSSDEHTANLNLAVSTLILEVLVCCFYQLINSICQQFCLDCREQFCVGHGDLRGWSRRSWRDTITGYLDCAEEFAAQHRHSCDWSQQSCLDSVEETRGQHDDSRLDQNIVCSDTERDAHCSATLHGTVTSMTLVGFLPCRLADDYMIATTSTQLGSSREDIDSSAAEQLLVRQPADSNDDMDVYDDTNSSTTEHVLVRLPDSNDDMDVSMAQEQPPWSNDDTRSVSWWLIPGFRFLPTDQEIVLHYLKHKVLNLGLPAYHPVSEGVNVYVLDADEITLDVNNRDEELLGFFFIRKEQKHAYTNGCFYTTPDGYWKVRGRRPARVKHDGRTVAFKTSMDYYRGRPPHGCRTPWSMFEFALNAGRRDDLRNLQQPWMNSYVMCKVCKRERASARAKKLPGLLPRRFRPKKMVQKDGALELKATAPRRAAGVPGILGKRKHDDLF